MRKKFLMIFKIICIFIVIVLILIIANLSAFFVVSKGNVANAVINMAQNIVGEQESICVVIVGVSEDINARLTDTIMLAGYNPTNNKSFLISIPRDTFICNDKKISSLNKLNSLYKRDKNEFLSYINDLTGLDISYTIEINNKAVEDIVNLIGGLEFDVPMNMKYDDVTQNLHINLKKGKQLLTGKQVEQLLRFRHNNNGKSYTLDYGDNDYGRMKTQRNVVKELVNSILKVRDVGKLENIVKIGYKNVKTNLDLTVVLSYLPYVVDFNIEDLKLEQIPGQSSLIEEIWFFTIDEKGCKELFNNFKNYLEL